MTFGDDFPGEMEEFPFDDTTADEVFGTSHGADPAPEEFWDIAELVQAARRTGSAGELVGEDVIVARIVAAMGEHAARPQGGAHERIVALNRFRTAKVTAAATAVLLLGGTAAAAASGSLPTPVNHRHAALAVVQTVAAPRHHAMHAPGASGVVASVNGVATPGTCGASTLAGTFTLTHDADVFTVNVDATTTTFSEMGVTAPTFANVCVGSKVRAEGAVVGTTVTATMVKIKPLHVRTGAMGTVASVNGVSAPGSCGGAGLPGTFTITDHDGKTFTVNVDPTTTFADQGVASPTFLNVCVGEFVAAKGTFVDPIVTATQVFIAPKHDEKKHDEKKHGDQGRHMGAFGTVASVNGVSDAGTCGITTGAIGSFAITGHDGTTFTVDVTGTTMFEVPGVTDPTFANVCVGEKVGAKGALTDTTVAATDVFVLGSDGGHHGHHGHGDDGDHHGGSGQPAPQFSSGHRGGNRHGGNGGKGNDN